MVISREMLGIVIDTGWDDLLIVMVIDSALVTSMLRFT